MLTPLSILDRLCSKRRGVMKRFIYSFLILFVIGFSVYAYELGSGISLDPVKFQPLYREGRVNPYSYQTRLNLTYMPEEMDSTFLIRTLVKDSKNNFLYKDYQTKQLNEMSKRHMNINMKLGSTLGLVRFSYKDIEFETNVLGYFNALFVYGGGGDCLGIDGSYFIGETVKLYDKYSFRLGFHHLSGHYGDESIDDFFNYNFKKIDDSSKSFATNEGDVYYGLASYVRDNNIQFATSADLLNGLYLYGSVEMPLYKSWVRPFIHCPLNHITGASDGADGFISLASSDGINVKTDRNVAETEKALRKAGYLALQFNLGAEYEYKFSFGTVFAAVDFQAHQDGQTKHQIGMYNSKNMWDFEITVGTGLELSDASFGGKKLSAEVLYHYGRPTVTQYYYKNTFNSISFGFAVR